MNGWDQLEYLARQAEWSLWSYADEASNRRRAQRALADFIFEWESEDGTFTSRQLHRMLAPNLPGNVWWELMRSVIRRGLVHQIPAVERRYYRYAEYAPGPASVMRDIVMHEEPEEVSGPTVEEIVENMGDAFKLARGEF